MYGSNNKKLTIDLTGTNYASTLGNGSGNGCTFEITSSTNGKLIIDSTIESGTIIGINTGSTSSETTGSVILSGSADVSVTLQHSGDVNVNNYAYAIYANEGIEIKDSASFTAKLKTKTAGPDRANGLYLTTKASGAKIVVNTTGNVSIDTSEDNATYNTPIYHSSSSGVVELQNVGKMTLKYKKYSTYGKDSYPDVTYATEDFTKNSVEEANIITTTYEAAAAETYSATVGNVTVSGTTGTAIADTEVNISLTNDKFNAIATDTDVTSWFTNLPNGLEAKVKTAVNADDTTATITISGTPMAASDAVMQIKLPAANLVSSADLTVTANANAKFNISAPAYAGTVPNIENKTVPVGTAVTVPWPEGATDFQRYEGSTLVGSGNKSGYPDGMYIPAQSTATTKTFKFKVLLPGGWVDSNEFTVTWTASAPKTLSSIAVTTAPTKVTYTAGEYFNTSGMVVTATYSDGSSKEVTGYTYTPTAALTTDDTSIIISYTEGGVTKTATQAITVNAVLPEFTITFDGNSGTPSTSGMTTTGQKLATLPTATRSGSYSFDGWYTASSEGTQVTTDTVFDADTTIYAQWNYTGSIGGGGTTRYTVSFDTNGGSKVSNKTVTRNTAVSEPTAPTKDGTHLTVGIPIRSLRLLMTSLQR